MEESLNNKKIHLDVSDSLKTSSNEYKNIKAEEKRRRQLAEIKRMQQEKAAVEKKIKLEKKLELELKKKELQQ